MHSRIFQMSSKPISKEDYLGEDYFYDDFVPCVGDYVSEVKNDTDSLKWLEGYLNARGGVELDIANRTLKIVDKEKYFESDYEKFKKVLDEAKNMTLSSFSRSGENRGLEADLTIYDLKRLYEGDKFGFYLVSKEDGYEPLNSYIRWLNNGTVLYIGAVFDYHS